MSATQQQDWTERHDPQENADTLGTMVKCALIEAGSMAYALKGIEAALEEGDIDQAKLIVHNARVGLGTVFTDFKAAWYEAIPRRGPGGGQSLRIVLVSRDQHTKQSIALAHQRARNEAISVIDTERQRLASLWHETSGPVRESLARCASYLGGLIDRLTGWRYD